MARYVALGFALGLLAGPAAAWNALNPDCDGALGTYSQASAEEMAQKFAQSVPPGTFTYQGASLIGAPYQSGVVNYCQGPFYDELNNDATSPNTEVLVFTTGYGQLPATVPGEGPPPNGFDTENYAQNDRFQLNTCNASKVDVTFPDGCVNGTAAQEFGNICPNRTSNISTPSFDASGLIIEFQAEKTASLSFNYIWGSDEYPEYFDRAYADQFRLLVQREAAPVAPNNGPTITQPWTNIAIIGGKDVGIDTINQGVNPDKFVANPYDEATLQTEYATQYDGFTKLLKTNTVTFVQGETVRLAFVVADCSDRILDSAVMIEVGSVTVNEAPECAGISIRPDPSAPGTSVEVVATISDDDLMSIKCDSVSGNTFECNSGNNNLIVVGDGTFSCTGTMVLSLEDFVERGIFCTGMDSIGQSVVCPATPVDPPPTCAGISFDPSPSTPGTSVDVVASFNDNELNTVICTFPSGESFGCSKAELAVDGAIFSCKGSVTLAPADYSAPVKCVGSDMSGQTVECQATPLLAVPSPSPRPKPSPAKPVTLPSPSPAVPPPSPVGCDVTKPDPVPPVGCPATQPNCNPSAANCTVYNSDLTSVINGPLTVSCSKCQWECLTNPSSCGGITLYNDTEVIEFLDLATYNCGDGGFGGSLFAPLCVLETGDGVYADVQNQPCFNCKQQCEAWEQCTGVFFEYIYYSKENLGSMCC